MQRQPIEYQFYCKIPYTNITNFISVNSSMTITDFINFINNKKTDYFNIHENYIVEIVESGNNINGDAELGPALESSDMTLEEKYGNNNKWNYTAFYIRPIDRETSEFNIVNDYSTNPTDQNLNYP